MLEFNTPVEVIKMLIQKIEQVRIQKKMTQKEFASKAGIAYGTYRSFLDLNNISLHNFIAIYQVLGFYDELNTLVKINKTKTIKEMKEEAESLPKRVKSKAK